MKYNAHIYCSALALILTGCKALFSFCANARLKDIVVIVNHHYHIFHVPRQFYSVNKSYSIVFQLHMLPGYVRNVYRVTR